MNWAGDLLHQAKDSAFISKRLRVDYQLTFEFCSSKFCISVFYRPPGSDVSYFDELFDIIENLDIIVKFYNYILLGDFNINFCNSTHPVSWVPLVPSGAPSAFGVVGAPGASGVVGASGSLGAPGASGVIGAPGGSGVVSASGSLYIVLPWGFLCRWCLWCS